MNTQIFEQARQARDPRFDGRFFIGVRTTGIYCRPVCRVKMPRRENITFYPSAAAAAEAGFRPCLRCRPETSPGTPAWLGTSTTVNRGLRLISEGALDEHSVEALADRLGVTSRHLSRLFDQHLGASPIAVAQTRRLHFAKKLLDETSLTVIDVAMASGYKSVRRFNDHFKTVYKRPPSVLRNKKASSAEGFCLRLGYRPPFDFAGILGFLAVRSIPGVESVTSDSYKRSIEVGNESGSLVVTHDESACQLLVQIDLAAPDTLMGVTEQVRRLFDLGADPREINLVLGRDPQLLTLVLQNPGQRVPGCWSPFEIAVRAIVGQQVSVKGATTVMGRIARQYGSSKSGLLCFPGPEALAELDVATLSMPAKRAQAIKDMSRLVAKGELSFSAASSAEALMQQLTDIKGIGPWTAEYITMRALNDPDAYLHTDLVQLKVARHLLGVEGDKDLLERSEVWRPWRAYAGMHLWRQASQLT